MKMIDLINGLSEQFNYSKFKLPMIAAVISAPLLDLFNEFIFTDWRFLCFMAVLIFLDTVTGVAKAAKRGVVSSAGFTGVILKVFVYAVFLIVLNALESFSEKAAIQFAFEWVGSLGYAAVIVRESISILENLGALDDTLIPKWILKRLKDFDKDGKINE